ncbi:MAG: MBL fold metallo-hydrolase [Bacteroidia bacterium]|nr:MBL fold metallo-hydrolase [Bacteroidia bacterium]
MPTRVRFELFASGYCLSPGDMILPGEHPRLGRIRTYATWGLIQHPTEGYILFDTGYGDRFLEEVRRFPERLLAWALPVRYDRAEAAHLQLSRLGIAPEEIRYVLLSHFHGDHMGGLADFPNARIICTESAYVHALSLSRLRGALSGFLQGLLPEGFEQRTTFVERLPGYGRTEKPALGPGTDLLGDGSLVLMPLPGHARGQFGVWMRTEDKEDMLLAADACWMSRSFQEMRLPAPAARVSMDNPREYVESLTALHRLYQMRPDMPILPCHCPDVYAAWVTGSGPFTSTLLSHV